MKVRTANAAEDGNLLLSSLLIAAITGVALASYLTLTQTQNVSIARSQSWNTSMAVTEAGVEDGLQLINRYAGSFEPEDLYQWTNTTSFDGWENPSPGVYHIVRYLPAASGSPGPASSYETWIYNTNNMPTVISKGNVPWTFGYAQVTLPQPVFAVIGLPYPGSVDPGTTTPPKMPPGLARKVSVQTRYDPLFVVAMAALDKIDLNGNNIGSDSFDSADPNFSNNGFYPTNDVSKTKANGNICTDSVLTNSMSVGNANIKGRIRTGPGKNTISNTSNASVGDRAWVETGTLGIKPGWSSTDFNVSFNPVADPGLTWLPPTYANTYVDGIYYQYVISDGGDYTISELNKSLLINAKTNEIVRIYVKNNVYLAGTDVIRIAPTGCKVRVYMAGNSFQLTGSSYIDNQTGKAQNFYLFGMQSCRSITFQGNGDFCGGIYAPQADFYLGGGGKDILDFIGASVTRTVTMNGHYRFHYDENLARIGPGRGYIPIAWQEI